MKLTFHRQMKLAMAIVVLFFTLALIFEVRILNNVGWVLYGLLWMINPVFPANVTPNNKYMVYMRIAGACIVLVGLTAHLG